MPLLQPLTRPSLRAQASTTSTPAGHAGVTVAGTLVRNSDPRNIPAHRSAGALVSSSVADRRFVLYSTSVTAEPCSQVPALQVPTNLAYRLHMHNSICAPAVCCEGNDKVLQVPGCVHETLYHEKRFQCEHSLEDRLSRKRFRTPIHSQLATCTLSRARSSRHPPSIKRQHHSALPRQHHGLNSNSITAACRHSGHRAATPRSRSRRLRSGAVSLWTTRANASRS